VAGYAYSSPKKETTAAAAAYMSRQYKMRRAAVGNPGYTPTGEIDRNKIHAMFYAIMSDQIPPTTHPLWKWRPPCGERQPSTRPARKRPERPAQPVHVHKAAGNSDATPTASIDQSKFYASSSGQIPLGTRPASKWRPPSTERQPSTRPAWKRQGRLTQPSTRPAWKWQPPCGERQPSTRPAWKRQGRLTQPSTRPAWKWQLPCEERQPSTRPAWKRPGRQIPLCTRQGKPGGESQAQPGARPACQRQLRGGESQAQPDTSPPCQRPPLGVERQTQPGARLARQRQPPGGEKQAPGTRHAHQRLIEGQSPNQSGRRPPCPRQRPRGELQAQADAHQTCLRRTLSGVPQGPPHAHPAPQRLLPAGVKPVRPRAAAGREVWQAPNGASMVAAPPQLWVEGASPPRARALSMLHTKLLCNNTNTPVIPRAACAALCSPRPPVSAQADAGAHHTKKGAPPPSCQGKTVEATALKNQQWRPPPDLIGGEPEDGQNLVARRIAATAAATVGRSHGGATAPAAAAAHSAPTISKLLSF
jgi:hypothetical protein